MRRSPWLDDRAALLVRILSEQHGLQLPDEGMDAVRADISDHLDQVAALMRIGRQAAKMYVTDEVIAKMAQQIATAFRQAAKDRGDDPPPPLHIVE